MATTVVMAARAMGREEGETHRQTGGRPTTGGLLLPTVRVRPNFHACWRPNLQATSQEASRETNTRFRGIPLLLSIESIELISVKQCVSFPT